MIYGSNITSTNNGFNITERSGPFLKKWFPIKWQQICQNINLLKYIRILNFRQILSELDIPIFVANCFF